MKAKLLLLLALLTCYRPIHASQLEVFAELPQGSGTRAGLTIGKNGDFYGALFSAVVSPGGAIFDVTSTGYVLPLIPLRPEIGANPSGALVMDRNGNLYGTATTGGIRNNGTIFTYTISGTLSQVAAFNGTNGSQPVGPLLLNDGVIYGTTFGGGANNTGAVFAIRNGVLTNLASFILKTGINPASGLIAGPNNSLLGTTQAGGQGNSGTIYALNSNGALQALASFTGTNSGAPGMMTASPDGNFYGVTTGLDAGTIFQMTPFGRVTTLHQFRGQDGAQPNSPLLLASDGKLYGTTQSQGTNGFGTLFSLSLGRSPIFTLLASFNGYNGAYPQGGLVEATNGNLYGISQGLGGDATLFQFGAIEPGIIKGPSAPLWTSNHNATISVVASGSQPLTYQWFFNYLAINGATNAGIEITNETQADVGTYSVIVSNAYGVTNAYTVLAPAPPTITLNATPASVTNSQITITGTAASPFDIQNVRISWDGYYWEDADLVLTNPAAATWTYPLFLNPGSNTVVAYSTDTYGSTSRPVRLNIFYRVAGEFTWITNGSGRIVASQKTNGFLTVDRPLTLTASPAPQNLFAGWTITSNNTVTNSFANPLTLLMPTNLVVEATFVTNFYSTWREITPAYSTIRPTSRPKPPA